MYKNVLTANNQVCLIQDIKRILFLDILYLSPLGEAQQPPDQISLKGQQIQQQNCSQNGRPMIKIME